MTYRIAKAKLDTLFARLASFGDCYLPVDDNNGESHFRKWEEGTKLSENLNTVRSAKDFFFPQVQNLADFKVKGTQIEVVDNRKESEDFVVFGVRGCDRAGFEVLDRVFLAEPVDTCYKTRREHATIITMACSKPAETCFCKTFGIDCTKPGGDVEAHLCGEYLYLEAVSEKGSALLARLADLLEECGREEIEAADEKTLAIMNELPLSSLEFKDLSGEQLDAFKSPEWAKLSEACLGCGTCTFVCPTCQCYDIKDFDMGNGEIRRFRCWDSCMYSDFTLMAHGNPRISQLERFRQRFMHKLVYYPRNNEGVYGCVGCGRCLKKCPVSMNIVKVMKKVGGDK